MNFHVEQLSPLDEFVDLTRERKQHHQVGINKIVCSEI